MGGLPRRLTFFKQQQSKHSNLFYLDLGNNFPEPSEQGALKIKLIQSTLKKLRPLVVLVGPNEWKNGLNILDTEIPYLLSNQGLKLPFLTSKKFSKSHLDIKEILMINFQSPSTDSKYQEQSLVQGLENCGISFQTKLRN